MTVENPQPGRAEHARTLDRILRLAAPPVAISFADSAPPGVDTFDAAMPPPTDGGRTGRVPAGCVFWMHAAERSFTTVPDDHANCSVGMLTHGMRSFSEAAVAEDVAAILEVGWITGEQAAAVPTITRPVSRVSYGPLASTSIEPDVVLLRINGRALMTIMDALPGVRIEGKPQCHIIAVAHEHGEVAVSSGCALSRARTGMGSEEMTCAIPAARLGAFVEALERTAAVDSTVARYAAADARRFG